jgi:hypothetical protein
MTTTPYEIYAIMKWSNLELQRNIDNPSSNCFDLHTDEYIKPERLAKMCKKELRRRKNVGLYIEEANEWERFETEQREEEEEELSMEERNQLLRKQYRKASRRPSLLNIGRKR